MMDPSSFRKRLQARLAAAAATRQDRLALVADRMRVDDARARELERRADDIHREVIRPMIGDLAASFPGCSVEHYKTPLGLFSRCRLVRTDRFPAATKLTIGLTWQVPSTQLELTYDCEVIPVLMDYARLDRWAVDPGPSAPDEVARTLGNWLLRFTETYLQLETHPAYQDWATHVDPVCGMRIAGAAIQHTMDVDRTRFYFCSEVCRDRFQERRDLYLTGRVTAPGSASGPGSR